MFMRQTVAKRQAEVDKAVDEQLEWLEKERQKYWSKQDPSTPGIQEFYTGKNILVTGGTGFIGKVLVEHLLRLTPGVGKIFVLIRVKRNQVASERLNAILNSELFQMLRKQQPDAINRVIAISGDLSEKGIGLSQEDRIILQNEVSVIFHAAATIRFDDPLKSAVLLNTRGTQEIIELSKGMRNLQTFVHVSTLYCNTDQKVIHEEVYPTPYDWRTMIKVAETNSRNELDGLSLKIVGFQPNTYTFTKQLSEKIVDDARKDVPVIIVRPGVVTAMRGEPFEGFMDNLNGPAGFLAGALPGILRVVRIDKKTHLNYTSVDATVRIIIAAGWLRGTNQRLNENPHKTDVVNTSCEDVFADTWSDGNAALTVFSEKVTAKCIRAPDLTLTKSAWFYKYKVFTSHILFGLIADFALRVVGMKPWLLSTYRKAYVVNGALLRFMMNNFPSNSQNLWRCISMIKEKEFKPDFKVNVLKELEPQWNYLCKHILHYDPVGSPTVFHLLQFLETIKSTFELTFFVWVVWKLVTFFVYRII